MRTDISRSLLNPQVLAEAADWFVDFRTEDVDAGMREQFHGWLRRSPDHIQAYLEIATTYAELPLPQAGAIDVDALIEHARSSATRNIIPLSVGAAAPPEISSGKSGVGRTAKASLALAASLLLALGTFWWYDNRGVYATELGERRSVMLDDGSLIELNSQTRVKIRFAKALRRVELQAGQALFEVAPDRNRPFVVSIGDTRVRAVGTQFDVYRKRDGTVVSVVEGKVAVAHGEASVSPVPVDTSSHDRVTRGGTNFVPDMPPTSEPVMLIAGEQITVKADSMEKSALPDVAAATSWTARQMVLQNASLDEVADEFNRYNARPLKVEPGKFAEFRVSGIYSSTNPASLLRFLRAQPGIAVVESEDEIRIVRVPVAIDR